MPHVISKNKFVKTNMQYGGFEIMDFLQNSSFSQLSLLPVKYENTLFFIHEIKRENDFLYKIDKLMKLQDLSKMKEILHFIKENVDIISHNINYINQKHKRFTNEYIKTTQDLSTINIDFIEIGFGSGRHILDLAKNNEDKNILGFEIHDPSIRQVANAINLYQLKNLFICNADVRSAIYAIKNNSIQKVFLHFPVPWNKAKHRRVFSEEFLQNVFSILKNNGIFNIRSDDEEYVKDCINIVLDSKESKLHITKNEESNIISKYEARWMKQKKDIFELDIYKICHENMQNNENENNHTSENKNDLKAYMQEKCNYDFSHIKIKSMNQLKYTKYVDENYFIGFKDLYSGWIKNEYCEILQVSFGNFNQPFSSYLLLQNNIIRLLKYPAISKLYIKIYDKLQEILNNTLEYRIEDELRNNG